MPRQHGVVSGIVRSILLINMASLWIGCSESNEAVNSRTVPDSSVVESPRPLRPTLTSEFQNLQPQPHPTTYRLHPPQQTPRRS